MAKAQRRRWRMACQCSAKSKSIRASASAGIPASRLPRLARKAPVQKASIRSRAPLRNAWKKLPRPQAAPLSKSTDAALPSWRTIGNGPGEFMSDLSAQFVGVELYFEDLERAKKFYLDTLGLHLSDEQPGHHAKFAADAAFVCLETKGSESYPPAIRPCFSSRCPISKRQ